MYEEHYPVMIKNIEQIITQESNDLNNQLFIDCTFGRGGHTRMILNHNGSVLALDRDPKAAISATNIQSETVNLNQFFFSKHNFSNIKEAHEEYAIKNKQANKISGVLWDFGLCTAQINSDKGFSFKKDDYLDMRMGDQDLTAEHVINNYSEEQLADIFYYYGDETRARVYAKNICQHRKKQKIETMLQLLSALNFKHNHHQKIHPATKVLQAIRIEVNNEFDEIEKSLQSVFEMKENNLLEKECKLMFISFHSGEDRIVKKILTEKYKKKMIDKTWKEVITPSAQEIKENPASRSAKLRWCTVKG